MPQKLKKVQTQEKVQEKVEEPPTADTKTREKMLNDIDELLDEIDEVLEEDAQEFVRSYIQKGGE